jgi:membrane glycosyltransferase
MRIVDDHEVSKSEQITRFICGALLGVVIAVAIYKFDLSSLIWKAGIALVSILGCGILALVQGDRFWQAIFGSSRIR